MKLGGNEIKKDDFVLVGQVATLEALALISYPVYMTPCWLCREMVIVGQDTFDLASAGTTIVCLECGLKHWPDMTAGRDPDTGNPVTLKQICNYPDKAAVYKREDVTEF